MIVVENALPLMLGLSILQTIFIVQVLNCVQVWRKEWKDKQK